MAGDSETNTQAKSQGATLERQDTILAFGKLKLRGQTDELPQDWWFASTAIPLLAATIGPLANVLSIAALVSQWRVALPNNGQLPEGADALGKPIPDPHWEIVLNALSLTCGFVGNFYLLLNFTRRIRYIVALPATIIFWFFATGLLIGTCAAMAHFRPPISPGQTWSQGFWYAIIAAVLYLIGSTLLMVNMLGYFLGHYPQHFDLDDHQRTLILQTMMFFFWLAGGAAVFAKVCGWSYADALYFCDVTVLTVGFGDLYSTNDAGRGLVFPYSVFGIIFLGLMINSIRKFALSMSTEKIIRKHTLNERERTFGRTVTNEQELRDRLGLPPKGTHVPNSRKASDANSTRRDSLKQYGRFDVNGRTITFYEHKGPVRAGGRGGAGRSYTSAVPLSRDAKLQMRAEGKLDHVKRAKKREKLIMLKEERDRFNAMREIQANTNRFKQYYALAWSVLAFGILWCVGAAVFFVAEKRMQNMTYFQALYFCYVSLLTIGYGDLSPKSNAGKPFFVVWSLVAVPTMTILVSDMGETIVSSINRGTFTLADWTVLPKKGVWHDFLQSNPRLRDWLERKTKEIQAKQRLQKGFDLQNPDEEAGGHDGDRDGDCDVIEDKEEETRTTKLEKLAEEPEQLSDHDLARKLALAIKRAANDLRAEKKVKYTYEEWAEFTRLIRFSRHRNSEEVAEEEEQEGLVEWDWIGEDSPMLADVTESEWLLERLCESLNRYTRRQASEAKAKLTRPRDHIEGKHSSSNSITAQNSAKRQMLHHDRYLDFYPAHPGPRNGRRSHDHERSSSYEDKVPSHVLTRNASGHQMVKIMRRNESGSGSGSSNLDSGRRDNGGSGSAGSSSESASTAVASARGIEHTNSQNRRGEKEDAEVSDEESGDGAEPVVSTAQAVNLKRMSSSGSAREYRAH